MRWIALLCAVLMLTPVDARAASVQTGVGYVVGQCRSIGTSDDQACFTGERWDLGLSFPVKDNDVAEFKAESKDAAKGKAHHSGNAFSGVGDGGPGIVIAIGIIVAVLILYGIYWAIVGVFSHRISMGLYASFDFQKANLEGEGDLRVEKYHAQSTGLQTTFYLMRDVDFALNVGVAGTTAQIETSSASEGDQSFNLRGISSKAGLGYVPFETTGIYALLEFEGTYFDGTTLSKYVRAEAGKLPQVRRSGALVVGLTF